MQNGTMEIGSSVAPNPPAQATSLSWSFRIPLVDEDETDCGCEVSVPIHLVKAFEEDGFVAIGRLAADEQDTATSALTVNPVLSSAACAVLNQRLEEILRGRYSRGAPPDKAPRLLKSEYKGSPHHTTASGRPDDYAELSVSERRQVKTKPYQSTIGPIGFSGNRHNVRVIQVINVQKADDYFYKLACSPILGQVVAQLAGWTQHGVRLASDQVWAKPPGAAPLAFHRDSPYFMFDPPDVVTVWVALDDMHDELGPLQYVRGSHLWGDGRVGTASQFFQSDGGIALLQSAAERSRDRHGDSLSLSNTSGDDMSEEMASLDIVSMAGLPAGGISIHHGLTWHGSGRNMSSSRPRRGLGLHFVPAHVRFTADAVYSTLWRPYVEDAVSRNESVASVEVPISDFPITWHPDH